MKRTYIPKEISWLYFNARVLQEAENCDVPVIERLKYLGIYSNNLDEYFRVRVATLKRLALVGKRSYEIIGYDVNATLKEIHDIVLEQRAKFEYIYTILLTELERENIFIINEQQLNAEQAAFVNKYFHKCVRPKLMPIMISQANEIPDLKDERIYFAICFTEKESNKENFAIMEIPTRNLSRFIELPSIGEQKFIIMLDDVVRFGMRDTFSIFDIDRIEAYTIKLTKDAEIDIVDNISESYLDNVSNSLKKRKQGEAVSFVYDQNLPVSFQRLLMKRFQFKGGDAVIPGGRYHNFKDFIKFPNIEGNELHYSALPVLPHKDLVGQKSIISVISTKDILLHYPYHSFDSFIDFLREASIDPKVTSISITLYRLAKTSSVANALVNAVKNGKTVTCVVELQARFDEEANIYWGNFLSDEGVRVIYGVPWLKVHSKLCLVTRREDKRLVKYACLGTGNFNEDTARIYTDHLLMTSDLKITNEVEKVFAFFSKNYKRDNFNHLLVSPFNTRNKISNLIKAEIKNAQDGKEAYIILKLNNFVDQELTELLYEASQAGVKVKLMIRGMCSLVAGIPGLSDNIEIKAIIDRFLEHTRIYIFCNDGVEKYFISSADMMTRNLDRRVEVTCPIYDEGIQQELKDYITIHWNDNVKSRLVNEKGQNRYARTSTEEKIRAQMEVFEYLRNKLNEKPAAKTLELKPVI